MTSPPNINDSSLLASYKDFIETYLAQGFLFNLKVVATLKLSLIKLAKINDPFISTPTVKTIYN